MSIHKIVINVVLVPFLMVCFAVGAYAAEPALKFHPDGTFTIVQFTDTQDGPNIDPRTITAMNIVLDVEKPDFVVITGDCVDTGKCSTLDALKRAINNIAQPMEARGISWAVTFGNHDRDNLSHIGISQDKMLGLYMEYAHNINRQSPPDVYGAGNANILIHGSASDKPVFGVWLIDSNAYAPAKIGDKKLGGYDWIHLTQVKWYWDTSVALEKSYGMKIPSLMFFHIPLQEFRDLMNAGTFTGEKNEGCSCSTMNSGLFTAALERGDVKGMFVGHDHIDTLVGDWYGIKLGYAGNVGYGTYGLNGANDAAKNRLRGARVFTLRESDPANFATKYVTANDLR